MNDVEDLRSADMVVKGSVSRVTVRNGQVFIKNGLFAKETSLAVDEICAFQVVAPNAFVAGYFHIGTFSNPAPPSNRISAASHPQCLTYHQRHAKAVEPLMNAISSYLAENPPHTRRPNADANDRSAAQGEEHLHSGPQGAAFSARTRETAQTERLEGELIRAVGANGAVVVFADHVSILRLQGALTGLLHGMKGDKDIRISKITSVQFRKPGALTRGYLQFEFMGGRSSQNGLLDATQDENTVLFDAPDLDAMLQVKARIDSLMAERETNVAAPAAMSAPARLREWKELLDMGALTQAEYDAKKAELLAGR